MIPSLARHVTAGMESPCMSQHALSYSNSKNTVKKFTKSNFFFHSSNCIQMQNSSFHSSPKKRVDYSIESSFFHSNAIQPLFHHNSFPFFYNPTHYSNANSIHSCKKTITRASNTESKSEPEPEPEPEPESKTNSKSEPQTELKSEPASKAEPEGETGTAIELSPEVRSELLRVGPSVERSASSNEELLLFFFQLDLSTRLQRALNLDQYEPAQQIREKIAETEKEVMRLREAKVGSASSSKDEAQNKALNILRLKSNLQKAVEEEKYEEAAKIKQSLSELETEVLAASALALASRSMKYSFRLGQKIKHKIFGYRGVICGMDQMCCESQEWIANALIEKLNKGKNQPFYQVLVEMSKGPGILVAYLAEEHILVPGEPDKEHFEHPYTYLLFYGVDANGDFVPTKQLRDKYNAPRHEVQQDENNDGEGI